MATLKIYSEINTADNVTDLRYMGYDGVSYKDVDEFVGSIPEDDGVIDVRLHCEGGVCTEGWAIYDRLRASGKEISCTVEGVAASMATVVLMAAPKERRKAYANATLLVHNPYKMPWGCERMTAEECRKMADELQQEQDRILDLYVERCGCDRDEMQALMDEDKPIDVDRALQIGLIGEIIAPASARANVEQIKAKGMEETKVKTSLLDKMLAKLGFKTLDEVNEDAFADDEGGDVVCMELSTAEGGTLTIEREGGNPQVGDKASPDGEHEMPDGRVIVVKDGVIEEIREAGDDEEDPEEAEDKADEVSEVENLRQEVETLKAQLQEAQKMAKTKEDLRILNAVKMAGGEKALKEFASNYVPAKRQRDGKKTTDTANERADVSPMRAEIEARRKGEWKKE